MYAMSMSHYKTYIQHIEHSLSLVFGKGTVLNQRSDTLNRLQSYRLYLVVEHVGQKIYGFHSHRRSSSSQLT